MNEKLKEIIGKLTDDAEKQGEWAVAQVLYTLLDAMDGGDDTKNALSQHCFKFSRELREQRERKP